LNEVDDKLENLNNMEDQIFLSFIE